MKFEIKSQSSNKITFIKANGKTENFDDLLALAKKYYLLIRNENNTRVVIDETNLDLLNSILDQTKLVNHFIEDEYFIGLKQFKIAIIIDKDFTMISKFWETFSYNRGYNFKVFLEIETALEWLK